MAHFDFPFDLSFSNIKDVAIANNKLSKHIKDNISSAPNGGNNNSYKKDKAIAQGTKKITNAPFVNIFTLSSLILKNGVFDHWINYFKSKLQGLP